MIEENWIDCICYCICFENNKGNGFYRYVALPMDFPKDKIEVFFKEHFKRHEITISEIIEVNDMWLSRKNYSCFTEKKNVFDELKVI